MNKQIVTFGKYKGRPIEALAEDYQYTQGLLAQDWFREKFPNHYTIIVNNFGEPNETPEHNQMQAQWLDRQFQAAFLSRFANFREYRSSLIYRHKDMAGDFKQAKEMRDSAVRNIPWTGSRPAHDFIKDFADRGLVLMVDANKVIVAAVGKKQEEVVQPPAAIFSDLDKLLADEHFQQYRKRVWECVQKVEVDFQEIQKFESSPPMQAIFNGKPLTMDMLPPPEMTVEFEVGGWDVVLAAGWGKKYEDPFQETCFRIELKPSLGDDYPAVLRQMKARAGDGHRFLIVREYTGTGATLAEAKKIFALSGYELILMSEVAPVADSLR